MPETIGARPPVWIRVAIPVVRSLPFGRYRLMNRLCRHRHDVFLARLPAAAGAYRFVCDVGDQIAREVGFTGCYEPLQTALFQRLVQPGATVIDVGANWGYFTLLAAHLVGAEGRVLGLEPDPRHFGRLRDNIAVNNLSHVLALPTAAAATNERLSLSGFDDSTANRGVSTVREAGDAGGVVYEVEGRPLDEILDEHGVAGVDLVKIDVEGYEHRVLDGMGEGLRRHRYRAVLIELHPTRLTERGVDWRTIPARLLEAGYTGWSVDHGPRVRRRAAYASSLEPVRYLEPVADLAQAEWPHTLWLAPGARFDRLLPA